MKFQIRDLVYATAIVAVLAGWSLDRQRYVLTAGEQELITRYRETYGVISSEEFKDLMERNRFKVPCSYCGRP